MPDTTRQKGCDSRVEVVAGFPKDTDMCSTSELQRSEVEGSRFRV